MCDTFNMTVRPLKPRNYGTDILSVHKSVLPKHITGRHCDSARNNYSRWTIEKYLDDGIKVYGSRHLVANDRSLPDTFSDEEPAQDFKRNQRVQ